jgi:hypothetical protein
LANPEVGAIEFIDRGNRDLMHADHDPVNALVRRAAANSRSSQAFCAPAEYPRT